MNETQSAPALIELTIGREKYTASKGTRRKGSNQVRQALSNLSCKRFRIPERVNTDNSSPKSRKRIWFGLRTKRLVRNQAVKCREDRDNGRPTNSHQETWVYLKAQGEATEKHIPILCMEN